eukprot:6373498-Prymnesium_polylepis.1
MGGDEGGGDGVDRAGGRLFVCLFVRASRSASKPLPSSARVPRYASQSCAAVCTLAHTVLPCPPASLLPLRCPLLRASPAGSCPPARPP